MTRIRLSLRPFELGDAAMVVPWLDAPGIGLPPGTARAQWAERLMVDPRVRAWIAEATTAPTADGAEAPAEPVGFVRLDIGPDRIAELTVAVAQAWRRRGVGSHMLSLVRQACRQHRFRRERNVGARDMNRLHENH